MPTSSWIASSDRSRRLFERWVAEVTNQRSFYEDRRVVVTGSTGLVGANLVEALLNRGAKVRGVIHDRPPVIDDPRVDYVSADLRVADDCSRALAGTEFVFHCAANTSGARVMAENPIAHITANLLLNSQTLEAAWREEVKRFLFISSSTVYPPVTHPVTEDEAFEGDPHDAYFGVGWMKRYIEKLSMFYVNRYGRSIAIVRPTNIFGPLDKFDPETSHVLPALIRRALEGEDPFTVWGDGTAVREFIYVSDAVEALLLTLELAADGRPVNIGAKRSVTIRESVDSILKLIGRSPKVVYDASQPSTIPARFVDWSRARDVLGWEPKVEFEEGLRRTIDWYAGVRKE